MRNRAEDRIHPQHGHLSASNVNLVRKLITCTQMHICISTCGTESCTNKMVLFCIRNFPSNVVEHVLNKMGMACNTSSQSMESSRVGCNFEWDGMYVLILLEGPVIARSPGQVEHTHA